MTITHNGEGSHRRLPIPAALVTGDASRADASKSESMNTLAHISLKRRTPLQLGSENSRKSDEDPMTEGAVYERIKNWLLAQTLVPGQLLQIGVLAEELGVSTTPVREALTRLAAERMIMSVPKRGFFARTPSEDDILGLYSVNQTILDAAVARWPQQRAEPAAVPAAAATEVVPVQQRSAEQLARQTGELFLHIATRSGVGEFAEITRNMNDRLHHARVLECEIIANVFVEVGHLAALAGTNEAAQLRQALQAYHEERLRQVAAISKELLLRPFTTADW
jgi:DNA-binding GntR family transcriptional regulator